MVIESIPVNGPRRVILAGGRLLPFVGWVLVCGAKAEADGGRLAALSARAEACGLSDGARGVLEDVERGGLYRRHLHPTAVRLAIRALLWRELEAAHGT